MPLHLAGGGPPPWFAAAEEASPSPGNIGRLSRRSDHHAPCRNPSTRLMGHHIYFAVEHASDALVPHADLEQTGSRSLTSRQPPQGHRPLITRNNRQAPRSAELPLTTQHRGWLE